MFARSAQGFTLVELVVILVIIGAIAAFSAPAFFNTQDFRQSGFYNETLASVRYAQKLAVASGCTVRVNITAAGFSLLRGANAAACVAGPFDTPVADPSDPARPYVRDAGGVALDPADFTFSPLGAASVTVPNQTIGVGGRQFRVWAETGFVERL